MKKIYTLFSAFALIGTGAFAQSAVKAELATSTIESPAKPASSHYKSAPIWTNNFDNAADWTVEADDTSHGWLITSSSVGWRPTSKILSTSGGNYALFRNGNPATSNPPIVTGKEWNLTTANPIDLSAHPNVAITYQIWGTRFVDDLEIQYSTDNITWKVADNIAKNIRTLSSVQPVNDFTNPSNRYGVMPDAGGSSTVWIRVRWVNSSVAQAGNDGIAYSYQVDDFAIIEAPAKELQAGETFPGSDVDQFFYYQQMPLEQAQLIEPRIVVSNVGAKTQNVKVTVTVLKDGAAFNTYTAVSDPLPSSTTDTVTIPTFTPSAKGLYTFNFLVEGDSKTNGVDDVEGVLTDNVGQQFVSVGDIYSDDKDGLEWSGTYYNPFREGGVATAPYANIAGAQAYEIFNAGSKAYGITTLFPNGTNAVSLDQTFQVDLYKMDPANYASGYTPADMELVAQTEYQIKAEDAFNPADTVIYTRIEFDAPASLEPGFLYIASVNAFGGSSVYNMPVFSDDNRDASGALRGFIQQGTAANQYALFGNVSPFIMLNLAGPDAINETAASSKFNLGQNMPNPFTGKSKVSYTLTESANVSMTITDITGKVVSATAIGNKAAGTYEYSVNSSDLGAGIYFYTLSVNGETATKKMVISE